MDSYEKTNKIANIIFNYSNDEAISSSFIKSKLFELYGIKVKDTRTILKAVDTFNNNNDNKKIYVNKLCNKIEFEYTDFSNKLSIYEGKALIDIVYSSHCFDSVRKNVLANNIKDCCEDNKSDVLTKRILIENTTNAHSNVLFPYFDKIVEAIHLQKRINYSYRKPLPNGEYDVRIHKNICPIETEYINNTYYVYCLSENRPHPYKVRIELMEDVVITNSYFELCENTITEVKELMMNSIYGFSTKNYQMIELTYHIDKYANLIDMFGDNLPCSTKINDKWYKINLKCPISTTFYGWIVGFGGTIRITGPENVVDDFKKDLQKSYTLI